MLAPFLKQLGTSLLIFLFFLFLMAIPLRETGQILEGPWRLQPQTGEPETIYLPLHRNLSAPFRASLSYIPEPSPYTTLALVWPDVTSLQVYWNGSLIHTLGDGDRGTGNFWNCFHSVELPRSPDGTDVITLKVTGHYSLSIGRTPYLADRTTVLRRKTLHNFIYNTLLMMFIGGGITMGVLLLLIQEKQRGERNGNLSLGLAIILASLYFSDYLFYETLGPPALYVILKKIFYSSGFLSTLFFYLYTEHRARRAGRLACLLLIPTLLAITAIGVLDLNRVRILLPYLDIVLIVNILAAALRSTGKLGLPSEKFLSLVILMLLLSVLEGMAILMFKLSWPFVLQNILMIAILLYGYNLILFYNQMSRHRDKLTQETRIDPLTGASNRRRLDNIDPAEYELISVIDLDNFKYYNDTYGHLEGDKLLKEFVRILQENLRKEDCLIRFGGDEFILFIKKASRQEGEMIMERIGQSLRALIPDEKIGFSYGIQELNDTLVEDLQQADRLMYDMKKKR